MILLINLSNIIQAGMVVRLAFAVQAHINPSVLIVDEALAVGDELFQKKCFARLEYLKTQGTSIVLVSIAQRRSINTVIRPYYCIKVDTVLQEILILSQRFISDY